MKARGYKFFKLGWQLDIKKMQITKDGKVIGKLKFFTHRDDNNKKRKFI